MRAYAAAAPAPVRVPQRPTPLPEIVQPKPDPPRHRAGWWLLCGVVLLVAGLGYRYSLSPTQQKSGPGVLRTSQVRRGPLEETVRLTGVTVAQKSAILLTPQMWGV